MIIMIKIDKMSEMNEMIIGYLYETEVYESIGDFVHGMAKHIREVGVPVYNISFNCHDNEISVFPYNIERHTSGKDIKKVGITLKFVKNLIKIMDLQVEINTLKTNSMDDILNLTKK